MDEHLFSEELASVRDLADRWDVSTHQLAYIVRSRKIPYAKMAGTTRLFDARQQKAIYAVFHKHLPVEGPIDLFPRIEAFEEEEAQEQEKVLERLAALESEVKALREDMTLVLKKLVQQG